MKVKSLSCVRLFATPMDWSLQGSSIHGNFQAKVLEWVAISFSRGSSQPRDWSQVSLTVGRRFTIWATREVTDICCCCLVAQLCPTLCDPMDCSPPGSSLHGILQARILEWVVIFFSRGSLWPRDWTHCLLHALHWWADSLPTEPLGKPFH